MPGGTWLAHSIHGSAALGCFTLLPVLSKGPYGLDSTRPLQTRLVRNGRPLMTQCRVRSVISWRATRSSNSSPRPNVSLTKSWMVRQRSKESDELFLMGLPRAPPYRGRSSLANSASDYYAAFFRPGNCGEELQNSNFSFDLRGRALRF